MRREGFTLIELLVVVAIVLALAIAIVPNIGAGVSGTQRATAARSLVQAVRYARTMAILHGVETELVLVSAAEGAVLGVSRDGRPDPLGARIEVRVAAETMRQTSAQTGGEGESGEDAVDEEDEWTTAEQGGDGAATGEGVAREAGTAAAIGAAIGDLAAEVASSFPCGTVVFEFARFTDEDDDEGRDGWAAPGQTAFAGPFGSDGWAAPGQSHDPDDEAARTFAVPFDSDGTCRPFELRLKDGPGDDVPALLVSFDRWGRGKIEGQDND
ncbi:MAG: type II secretion system protein [Kiritimatiellae bacterium]|nr:type II secretion system protein [Kiritimatiellia bacterium]